MDIALYARVSSDRQDVDLSIAGQLRALRDYAVQHGHQVIREFVDEAERSLCSLPLPQPVPRVADAPT